jgi:cytochrome oxidase assembly protein ShyY1
MELRTHHQILAMTWYGIGIALVTFLIIEVMLPMEFKVLVMNLTITAK